MNHTDTDIQAIVDTKTEQLQKEIELKDEEYNILKVTSEQIEEEQRRQIYELQLKIEKVIKKLKTTIIIDTEKMSGDEIVEVLSNREKDILNILEEEEE